MSAFILRHVDEDPESGVCAHCGDTTAPDGPLGYQDSGICRLCNDRFAEVARENDAYARRPSGKD